MAYSRKSSVSRFSLSVSNKKTRSASTARNASISKDRKSNQANTSIKRRDPSVSISSHLIHTHQNLESFNDLTISSNVKTITVDHNNLTDFRGLPSLSKLEKLDVSFNPIQSLLEIPYLQSIKTINIHSTPFCNTENFRVSLIILFGSTLRTINGEPVSAHEFRVAKEYLPDCANLIRSGWIASYPPPNPQEILKIKKKLSKNFALKYKKKNEVKPAINNRTSELLSNLNKRKLDSQYYEIQKLAAEIEKLNAQNM